MVTIARCVHVSGDSIVLGIHVPVDENGTTKLPIGNLDYLSPDGSVHWAYIRNYPRQEGEKHIMCCKGYEQSVTNAFIVHVKLPDLNFGEMLYAEGLKLSPGVLSERMFPLWSSNSGRKNSRALPNREQIWLLKPGEEVFLVDRWGGIRLLRFGEYGMSFYEPERKQVIAFFQKLVQKEGKGRSTHVWAMKNLKFLLERDG